MSRKLVLLTFVASSFIAPAALAQRWLSQLPQKSEQELTFEDYKRAFESYYKEHPVDLAKREKLAPTFRFEGTEEIQNRTEVEEYKLFKRWEWFTEPRTYPTGRWNLPLAGQTWAALTPSNLIPRIATSFIWVRLMAASGKASMPA